jgi:iron complex transport system substrate-binding protein
MVDSVLTTTNVLDLDTLAHRAPATDDLLELAAWLRDHGAALGSAIERIELAERLITRRRFLVSAGALVLAGCGVPGASTPTATPAPATTTRTVTDDAGVEVIIPAQPQRVAAAGERVLTEMLVAFGVTPIAAAATEEFAPFLNDALADRLATIQPLGSADQVNIEALTAAQPDLIIIDAWEGNPVVALARQIAPTVQVQGYNRDPYELIDTFGRIFSAERAQALRADLDTKVEQVRAQVGDPSAIRVSVAQVRPDGIRIWPGTSSLGTRLLATIGFARPEPQQVVEGAEASYVDLGLEALDQVDGDVLFLIRTGDDEAYANLTSYPLWRRLAVVHAGDVYEVDYRAWNVGGALAATIVLDDIASAVR